MNINTIANFKKIEKEIKRMLFLLIAAKDENEELKQKVKDLENFRNSTTKDMDNNQKIFSEYESLKAKYNNLLAEKKQLNEKVKQMLKKLEIFQPY